MTLTDDEHKDLIIATINLVKKRAEDAKNNSAMAGRWDDGGYSQTISEIQYFTHGHEGNIPKAWLSIYNKLKSDYINERELEAVKDTPEYQQFLELKKRFGHIR